MSIALRRADEAISFRIGIKPFPQLYPIIIRSPSSSQRAAAMMVREVDRRETADAVKRFRPELRDAAESHLRQEEGVRDP